MQNNTRLAARLRDFVNLGGNEVVRRQAILAAADALEATAISAEQHEATKATVAIQAGALEAANAEIAKLKGQLAAIAAEVKAP